MTFLNDESLRLSVILPCLNEGPALGASIREVLDSLSRLDVTSEIIVVDNGSSDDSRDIAASFDVRLFSEARRGYGFAIRAGIEHSRGSVVIISDGDSTYDLLHLEDFFLPIAEGRADVVMGNRFLGSVERGAMPLSHRLGGSFLSFLGRLRFGVSVGDFHCGLRAISRRAAANLSFSSGGMEFATEFIALAAKNGLRILEVPANLKKCRFKRISKLHTFRDGLRHLKLIFHG